MDKKYQPPKGAAGNARKVIEWKEKHGDEVKGMTQTGWVRARQLASGKPVSADIVKRMAAFNRHRKNAAVDPKFKDTPWKDRGYVAWLGWGGDTGVNWAIKTSEGMKNVSEIENMADEKNIIKIYGTIGREVWADDIEYQLDNMEGDVTVKINSVGGSVLEAIDIFNALKAYSKGKVTTVNMGKALSAGSYIFLAGDRRVVMSNSLTMIHAARMDMAGATETQMDEAKKMLGAATLAIAKEYSKALGTDLAMAKTLLDSGDVWYDASEALESGLATEVVEPEHQATSAVLLAEVTAAFNLPEKYLSKLEITMTDLISKLEAFTNDAELILNCVKDGLTYEQSLEAIIKNMDEKKEDPKSEEDEDPKMEEVEEVVEATEEDKVEATEEEDKVEAEEKEEMTAEDYLKQELGEEKYAEYEEMKSMEEDKPEAEGDEEKPEAEGDKEDPEMSEEDKMENTEEEDMDNEDEEDKMKALLKTGVKPVAVSNVKPVPSSARQQWKDGIESHMAKTGCDRVKAIMHMNITNPELRLLMIEEANK